VSHLQKSEKSHQDLCPPIVSVNKELNLSNKEFSSQVFFCYLIEVIFNRVPLVFVIIVHSIILIMGPLGSGDYRNLLTG